MDMNDVIGRANEMLEEMETAAENVTTCPDWSVFQDVQLGEMLMLARDVQIRITNTLLPRIESAISAIEAEVGRRAGT